MPPTHFIRLPSPALPPSSVATAGPLLKAGPARWGRWVTCGQGPFYSPTTPAGSVFCHLPCGDYRHQLSPLIMERILVLLLVTLAVAYALPGPRGIFINLVRGSLGGESSRPPQWEFF